MAKRVKETKIFKITVNGTKSENKQFWAQMRSFYGVEANELEGVNYSHEVELVIPTDG